MIRLLGLNHPFFARLWVRVAVVVVCFGWGAFEIMGGETFWGVLFIGLGLICAWHFATIDYSAPRDD